MSWRVPGRLAVVIVAVVVPAAAVIDVLLEAATRLNQLRRRGRR